MSFATLLDGVVRDTTFRVVPDNVVSVADSVARWHAPGIAVPANARWSQIHFRPACPIAGETAGGLGVASGVDPLNDVFPFSFHLRRNGTRLIPQRVAGVHFEEIRCLVSALIESNHKTVSVQCVRLRLIRRELVDMEDAELFDGFEVPQDGSSALADSLGKGSG